MTRFLCFRLHGPLASWGEIAVGERRPTSPHPSRSAILGLVAGALGIRRDDADGLQQLDEAVGFASRTDAPGELLLDFHTAQGPHEKLLRAEELARRKAGVAWHRPATRRDEVAYRRAELKTLLSQREYRVDALWTVALWLHGGEGPHRSLDDIAQALARPRFVPFLGRKSCPLDIPMEPQVIEAADPVSAMAAAVFRSDALLAPVKRSGEGKGTVRWEGAWPGLEPDQTSRRRDRVLARSRWQFTERAEHQRAWIDPRGGEDVPEQG
jgi:CRISPR system Cascade subunit CasD